MRSTCGSIKFSSKHGSAGNPAEILQIDFLRLKASRDDLVLGPCLGLVASGRSDRNVEERDFLIW